MSYVAGADRYETMRYNRVGRSGLKLPAVSLGLWNNFGFDRPLEVQRAILRRAFDLGITHFDLADNYGPTAGAAETNFGRIFAADFRSHRDELIISTKAGYQMWDGPYGDFGSRKHLLSSLDASLARLGVDYVDIFYSHRADPETPIEETMGALATAVQQGKALYAGISNYSPDQTLAASAALAERGIPLLIQQQRYNMFDRKVEHGLFPVLDQVGAGAIAYSPLAQGLLTDRYLSGIPADSRAAKGRWISAENISHGYLERARALNEIASKRGQSLAQLAITWVLRDARVASALVGASSVRQLDNTVAALSAPPLEASELIDIEPYAVDGTGSR